MASVVDGWDCNQPILNIRFVDFAAYYRHGPRGPCVAAPVPEDRLASPIRHRTASGLAS